VAHDYALTQEQATYSAQQTSARFVGELVLELSVERTGSCSSQQLIEEWRRHLPEAWKKYAQLELIQVRGSYRTRAALPNDICRIAIQSAQGA
jgi:hypothetical protein